MPSTFSTNLKIELMATGENSGTWGTVTNTNLGTALEQAVVGYGNPNYSSDANLTITLTDSNAAQAARALVLNVTSSVSLTGTRELVVPTIQKQYIVQNNTTGSQSITVKTSAGTGVTIPNGKKMHVYVNGTDVVQMDDFALIFNVDNLTLDGNTLSSTDTNGNIVIAPNGTGDVQLDADTVRVGDSNANATITTNGTGDLILNTNAGTNSGSITIEDGVNGNIIIAPNGTGQVQITNAALDLTTIEVSNINANDGTAAITIANATGAVNMLTAVTMSATADAINLGTSQTTGTFTIGGTAQTGTIALGRSTKTQSVSIATGSVESGETKTINIGTTGDSGSTTTINIGSGSGTITTNFSGTVNAVTTNIVGSLTASNAVTFSATTQNIALGTSQSSGTWTAGGASQTGALTLDQSTKTHTLNLGTGATESGETKTINLGTGGVSTSTTAINIGSANGTTLTINSSAVSTPNGLNFDSNTFVIDATNNRVGIGAISPIAKLNTYEVNGGGEAATIFQNFSTTTNTTVALYLSPTNGNLTLGSIRAGFIKAINVGGGVTALTFGTNSSGADPTEKMRIDGSGNVGIGTVTPTNLLSVAGNANITGNVTLGDASTDTVTVNGYMAVGGALNSGIAVRIGSSALGGATQRGAYADVTFTSASTTRGAAFESNPSTAVASFTVTDVMGFSAQNVATLGAGSTITNQHGVYVNDQTRGTNNFGITSLVSSGSNKWNIYASGTAANYFAGNVLVGTTASLGTAGVQAAAVATDPFEGYRFGANANGPTVSLYKNRGATVGTNAVVVSGDELGTIAFRGYDGAAYRAGAFITGNVDGTPGASDMPGRLTFSTTADGAATPTERMRIDASGNVRVGTAALATTATNGFLYIPTCAGTPTGTPTAITGLAPMVIDSTNNKLYIYSGGAWVALN